MRQTIAQTNNQECVNIFQKEKMTQSDQHRIQAQKEQTVGHAQEVAAMLGEVDAELSVDRERAAAMLAEYSGLLELVLEDIRQIRDIDESFGGGRRNSKLASLALKFERGIAYLVGMFSVVSSGEELPDYNWRLVQRDVQEVAETANRITEEFSDSEIKLAA